MIGEPDAISRCDEGENSAKEVVTWGHTVPQQLLGLKVPEPARTHVTNASADLSENEGGGA